MQLPEMAYRTLLVSDSQKMTAALLPLLDEVRCRPVQLAKDAAEARRRLLENQYDLLIINAPLTDEFGSSLAMDTCLESSTGVLLLVRAEYYPEINARLSPHGVFVVSRPTSAQLLSQSVTLLCATRERLKRMEKKTATIEEKMEEIRLVNRAKWILVEQLKMTEPDAHHFIQKSAMDRGESRRAVAESIIRMYE